ncbi:response regulator transcription factor [Flavobacterium rhamnosiphilum]|uniref:Response regulator transcription factor n=1 Tax=Flavobacterium rhamnosiphilum TaxID=2541724 RepID=A0A4R5FAV1_9FLAO|nr:response regulator transcription factor [Flavobacterium rhamnosiphilum]TDE45452.1 response regulator transcription factor [Flavobacterium rhamnosiphilum]
MEKSYNIFIVDDHTLFCDGLQNIIDRNQIGVVTAILNNGKSLLSHLNLSIPDLIILDLNMPELNGFEATKKIRKNYPGIKILVVSMKEEIKLIKELKTMGISGYLTKFIGESDLIEAVENIKNGNPHFPILDHFDKTLLEKKKDNINITESEIRIMRLVIEGFSSKEIAGQLHLSVHTVNTHRKNIIRKTSLKNTAAMMNFVKKNGL